ncbi:MAG TPA: ATP-grasp domain-containing protein [Ferruginibacter sp.]|nr:ATP-grasp domain-containing protein [Ferruginibacter sp.]HMP19642.1 ATP-grasp domain-containing protein [Ferruginibacter sp.]
MNILLTSVGRRNYIVEYFKEALQAYNGKVYAMNSDVNAPGLWVADEYVQSPLIYDASYKDFLLGYCVQNNIRMVISLFDIELPVLSKLKPEFEQHGITIVVGDEWLTTMANDKWKTQAFLKDNGFNTVRTFLSVSDFKNESEAGNIRFPVFIKPRWGMGSISIFKADDVEAAIFYYNKAKEEIMQSYLKYESKADAENAVLIQEALPGHEYGLDIINDLEGNYCTTIVKQKLAMRAGETDVAITVDEPVLKEFGGRLSRLTRHPGNMDVDVFFDGQNAFVLELNPRFGGGYPFSHIAGVNLPKAIIRWYNKDTVDMTKLLTPLIGIKAMKGIAIIAENNR